MFLRVSLGVSFVYCVDGMEVEEKKAGENMGVWVGFWVFDSCLCVCLSLPEFARP